MAAVVDVYGKGNVSLVLFDAHYDATKVSHCTLIAACLPATAICQRLLDPCTDANHCALGGRHTALLRHLWIAKSCWARQE